MVTLHSTPSVQSPAESRDADTERPRWCVDADWRAALAEARATGYTGRAVERAAADVLSERYGYR